MSRVLILDDDAIVARSLADTLKRDGHACETAGSIDEALARLGNASEAIDLLVTEMQVQSDEGLDGLKLLRRLRDDHPGVVPLVVTGYGKIEDAVRAIKLGAADYLTKPVLDDELREAVRKAGELHALMAGVRSDAGTVPALLAGGTSEPTLEEELGGDVRVVEAIAALGPLGAVATPVMILGEAGVGRTRLAEALHARSVRKQMPCVSFVCRDDADPRHLAELVGHNREAFAEEPVRRGGAVGEARGGTLIVRELHLATPVVQAALFELLEHSRARPIGSSEARSVEVRLVFTIDADGQRSVRDGVLRADLFHRGGAAQLSLPALRRRPEDVAGLARHFVARASAAHHRRVRLGGEALDALRAYAWPGNRDELRSACEHAVLRATTATIGVADLPESVRRPSGLREARPMNDGAGSETWTPRPLVEALLEPERQILQAALEANGWNRSETARQLGIDRTTLYKKIRKFRLDEPQ